MQIMQMHSLHVKGAVRFVAEESEKVLLIKELQRMVPESQGARAVLVGVSQGHYSRWEGDVEAGKEPKIGTSGLGKLRAAVERAKNRSPDYERGVNAAVAILEDALGKLKATLPLAPAAGPSGPGEHGPRAKRGRASRRRRPPVPRKRAEGGDDS